MTSHWLPLVLNADTFAVLWEKLGIGPLPRALFRLSPGSTRAERARIEHAAAVELSDLGIGAGGSIDHELTAALRLLAAPRIECYGWLMHCRTVSVLAASRGRHAVLATVDERSIALSPADPDALVRAVAGELPPAPPAAASLSLPAYSRAAFEHTTGAAITGHGQLLAAARDKLGRRRQLGDVLEYVDTTWGRWLLRRDPAVAVPGSLENITAELHKTAWPGVLAS